MRKTVYSYAARTLHRFPPTFRHLAFPYILKAIAPSIGNAFAGLKGDPRLPKIVVGFLSSPSGLGQSARLAAAAFREAGFVVLGIDLTGYFPGHPKSILQSDFPPDGSGHRGAAHVVAVINAPEMNYALCLLGRNFLRDKFVSGYWAWELQRLPASWDFGFEAVHEVITPSRFSAGAIAARGIVEKVRVAPHPVVLDRPPKRLRKAREEQVEFTIVSAMSASSSLARKNPLGLIRAFQLAFGNSKDVLLKLLITDTDAYPSGRALIVRTIADAPNIVVRWNPFDRQEFFRWWSGADVLASLHRSEGFGLPIAEAMCAGYPVVATGWSGNMDYMDAQTAFPVKYRLVEVDDPQKLYQFDENSMWADPDCEHAAELFVRLRADPESAEAIGAAAEKAAQHDFSVSQFVTSMLS
jgi:glycosyltransferase involved in cell wall biosynthesis